MAPAGTSRRHFFSMRRVGALRRRIAVNPQELQSKYARLHGELASLEASGEHSKAKKVRLAWELDQIDRQLAAFRRLAQAAPTLRDVVESDAQSAIG
jgi:hypothetical protein